MDESIQYEILEELKIIKKLLALNLLKDQSQTDRIEFLDSIGIKPKEIAKILGATSNTVSVTLNRIRKGKIK